MRNLKKFLALVLAMAMAFSLMVTANAASDNVTYPDSDSVTEEFQEAVTVLGGMGIMTGDNGNFYPERTIMRSEMAAVLYRLMTGDTRQLKNQLYADIAVERFNDVTADAWFAPYIGWCYDAGLMVGSNGYVRPWDPVTGYETLVMVLRAMGYGKNHEYTGSGWYVNASSDGTLVGLLADVNNTHYANTLSRNSTREVVASIVFQGAQLPTVRYELGYYNKYVGVALGTGDNKLNPSLGRTNFGLCKQTGIVVGNQATGEEWTKVGVVAKGVWNAAGALTDVELSQTGSYVYTTTASGLDGTTVALSTGNVTVQFNFGTGLEYFGHKVNTWYDCRTATGTQKFNGVDGGITTLRYNRTYAVIDKANKVATVWADDTTDNAPVANKTSIYTAAVNAGFNPQWGTPGWESDRFSQMGANADNAVVDSKIGTYTIISNNGDLTPDVVISLNQEVAQINQVNTTVKDGEYIYLNSGNSRFGGKVGIVTGTEYGGKLLDVLLAPGSEKALGTLVTANEIVGTTPIVNGANVIGLATNDTTDRDIKTDSTAITIDAKFCRYETKKLEPAFTGTVSTYVLADVPTNTSTSKVVSVTLTDGKTYDLSGITGSNVNETNYPWNFDTYQHLINGLGVLTGDTTSAGTTYTFYTDVVGRFIGVSSSNDYEFLYTTFADYELGSLGTGTSGYYVYGVNWDGEIVKDKQIVSITEPTVDAGTGKTDNFDDDTPNNSRTYPNVDESLAVGYNNLPVTLRDQGNATAGVVGNQIRSGVNTRFVVNGAGDMDWYNVGGKYGVRFMGWWDANASGGAAPSYTWTITASDARNGFVRVYNNNQVNHTAPTAATDNTDYLLTENTKFIVVTGSGTADLKVTIYEGLTKLLDGGTSAEITYDFDGNGDNVYFLTSAQKYGNTNTTDNGTIDTVIMSDTNLTQYNMQSLFFSKPGNEATGVKLAGDPGIYGTINQYEMYNKGVKGYYWISDTKSSGNDTDANTANGTDTKGDFYRLTPIGEVNGQTIYKADCVVAANADYNETKRPTNSTGSNVNQQYDYIVVNDLSTAAIGNVTGANTVMKVTGATVTQVFGDNQSGVDAAFPAGLNITDLLTLNHAVAMGKAGTSGNLYTISVAIVYDGINVTDIYVTNVVPVT